MPDTLTIAWAIDLATNGIILVQAEDTAAPGKVKTGLLLPVDIEAHARGTIDAPGRRLTDKRNGEYGYETVMMENADSEDNTKGKRDCDTAAVDRAKDDDLVKIVLRYSGPKTVGASLELRHEGIAVDASVKGSEMEDPEDAIEVLDTGSRLNFYDKDGKKLNPATDLKIADLGNPGSDHLAKILDPANDGELTLFIEGADDFGSVGPSLGPVKWNHGNGTISRAKSAAKKLGGARLKLVFENGDQKGEVPLLVYRGGFLAFKQPDGAPGTVGTLEFWDGKGRIRHEYGGHGNEFKEDDTDWGTRLKSWNAKSGKTTGKDYNVQGGLGHIPPGWWINYERTVLTGGQKNQYSGSGNSRKIKQGAYCRWEQDDAAANDRYTKNYEYKESNTKDKTIGEPKSISYKFELLPLPPTSALTTLQCRVSLLHFDPGVFGRKFPVDLI